MDRVHTRRPDIPGVKWATESEGIPRQRLRLAPVRRVSLATGQGGKTATEVGYDSGVNKTWKLATTAAIPTLQGCRAGRI